MGEDRGRDGHRNRARAPCRKPGNGSTEIDENDGRGASSAKDGWRSVRVLNPMSEGEAKDAGIKGKLRRSYFRTDIPKGNMFAPTDKVTWHKFVSVELGNGTDDYPDGDKIGVVTKWEMPGAFDGASVKDIGKIQALLSQQEWAKDSQAQDWVGHAVVGSRSYTRRRDGSETTLAIWQSQCVICGANFEVTVPGFVATAEQSKSFLMATCGPHRKFTRKSSAPSAAIVEPATCSI
jgi:hypothetical protein